MTSPGYTYRTSIDMGYSPLTRIEIDRAIRAMVKEWQGSKYSLIEANCCDFTNELCVALGVGDVPQWVNALANSFVPLARGAAAVTSFPSRIQRSISDIQLTGGSGSGANNSRALEPRPPEHPFGEATSCFDSMYDPADTPNQSENRSSSAEDTNSRKSWAVADQPPFESEQQLAIDGRRGVWWDNLKAVLFCNTVGKSAGGSWALSWR